MTDKSNDPTSAKVQPDDVPVGLMFGLLGGLIVVVIVALVLLWQFFGKTADKVVAKQSLAKPSRVLKRVLRKQARQLATMGVLDEARGKYRIPINDAMKILIDNQHLIDPAPKPPSPIVPEKATSNAVPIKAAPAAAPTKPEPAPAAAPTRPAPAPAAAPTKPAPGAAAPTSPSRPAAPAARKRGR